MQTKKVATVPHAQSIHKSVCYAFAAALRLIFYFMFWAFLWLNCKKTLDKTDLQE